MDEDEEVKNQIIYKYSKRNTDLEEYIKKLQVQIAEMSDEIRKLYMDKAILERRELGMSYRIAYLENQIKAFKSSGTSEYDIKYRKIVRFINALRSHIRIEEESASLDSSVKEMLSLQFGKFKCEKDMCCNRVAKIDVKYVQILDEFLQEDQVDTLQEEDKTLLRRLEKLMDDIKQKDCEIEALSNCNKEQKNQIMYLLEMIEPNSIVGKEKLILMTKYLIKKNTEERKKDSDLIKKLTAEANSSKEELKKLSAKYGDLESEYSKYQKEVSQNLLGCDFKYDFFEVSSISEIKKQNIYLSSLNRSLFEQVKLKDFDIENVKRDSRIKDREMQEVESQLRFKIIENENLISKNKHLEKLSLSVEERQLENSKLIFLINEKSSELENVKSNMKMLQEKYDKYVLKNEKYSAVINEIERVKEKQAMILQEANSMLNFIKNKENNSVTTTNELSSKLDEYVLINSQLKDEIQSKNLDLRRNEEQILLLENNNRSLQAEITRKNAIMDELEKTKVHSTEEIKFLNTSIEILKEIEIELNEKLKEAEKCISDKENVLKTLMENNVDQTLKFLGKERFLILEENKQLKFRIKNLESITKNISLDSNINRESCTKTNSEAKIPSKEVYSRILCSLSEILMALSAKKDHLALLCSQLTSQLEVFADIVKNSFLENKNLCLKVDQSGAQIDDLTKKLIDKEEIIKKYLEIIEKLRKVKEAYIKLKSSKQS